MNESLVAAAGQKNITVAPPQDAEYTIRGYLVAAADAKGTKLSYIWDITDKSGKRAKRIQGDDLIEGKKGGDPWALVNETAIQRIAGNTAEQISSWMSGNPAATASTTEAPQSVSAAPAQTASTESQQKPAQSPSANILSVQTPAPIHTAAAAPETGPRIVVVQPVTGAPGDGSTSLTDAMKRHLEQAGVKVADGGGASAFTIKGSVTLGDANGGQQPITIRWLVVDPTGKTMEKAVVQRNKVPQGSLDGAWGQIADLAAGEAAKSVAKLINPTS